MDRKLRQEIKNINNYLFIKLPNEAITHEEFLELNEIHIKETIKDITKKSIALENIFQYIIKLILYRINDKYSFKNKDEMYDFFNVAKALENVRETDLEVNRNREFVPFVVY